MNFQKLKPEQVDKLAKAYRRIYGKLYENGYDNNDMYALEKIMANSPTFGENVLAPVCELLKDGISSDREYAGFYLACKENGLFGNQKNDKANNFMEAIDKLKKSPKFKKATNDIIDEVADMLKLKGQKTRIKSQKTKRGKKSPYELRVRDMF